MTPPVIVTRSDRGLEVHVAAVPGWDGFDKLTQYVIKHHAALVLSSVDGPDARVRRFQVGSTEVVLDYEDPYGNTFVAADPPCPVLLRIASDLERRLGGPTA
ncbi:hypothetical protein SK069_03565 [Patulibacter brassicae]|uniref:Uncharacterized protein n=1 Tax=Patulibacter brassicae TaxID=1705717 RepID=A0ABU4VGW0_9ACTN|nr:hypothetical protein [Patulibacter brassicae]MDX8150660.1 hypothetical protein [Patulibacter brassicae]